MGKVKVKLWNSLGWKQRNLGGVSSCCLRAEESGSGEGVEEEVEGIVWKLGRGTVRGE